MSSDGGRKKNYAVYGIASILLVAAVVGTVIGIKGNSSKDSGSSDAPSSGSGSITTTNKAAKALCQQTDYKQTCEDSLKDAKNTSDPKELVKIAFNAAVVHIEEAMKNSVVLQEAAKDPRTTEAFKTCKEVLNTSIDDLKRSFDQVGTFTMGQMDDYVADVKAWLSGAITNQETCLDAFENTTGDTGEKMKKLLKTSGELTSNGLAMVGGITEILGGLQLSSFSRRLLEHGLPEDYSGETSGDDYRPYPGGVDSGEKKKLGSTGETSGDDYRPYPGGIDSGEKRKLGSTGESSGDDYRPYPGGIDSGEKRKLGSTGESSGDDYRPYPGGIDSGEKRKLGSTGESSGDDYRPYPGGIDSGEKRKLGSTGESSGDDYRPYPGGIDSGEKRKLGSTGESSGDDYRPYPGGIDSGEKRKLGSTGESSGDDYRPYPGGIDSGEKRKLGSTGESSGDDYRPYPGGIDSGEKRKLGSTGETSGDDYRPYPGGVDSLPTWADKKSRALLQVDVKTLKPNATIAQDGSGTHKTINEALKLIQKKSNDAFVVFIKAGIYQEYIEIPRHYNNIVFIGEGPSKTRITGNKNYVDGIGTYRTATVAVNGDRFLAKDIAFENTAGPLKHQAVALRVSGDMAIFHNCQMDGYQDTLYTHSYRQYYRECNISGTIDFIFGDAAAIFQKCVMTVRKPLENQACMVTAQGRKDRHSLGALILQGCTITAERAFTATIPIPKSYLGRPWKEYSRTIIMQSFIDSSIDPEGWAPWAGTYALDTCYYAEYNNKGPGSNQASRVTWKGIKKITPQEAESFTAAAFIQGDEWIKPTGLPYDSGMMQI